MAYQGVLHTDFKNGLSHCSDPRAYLAGSRKHQDPDSPSFSQAMTGANQSEWEEAMKLEISTLLSQNTWKRVSRSDLPKDCNGKPYPVLKGMWALKPKRLPDGSPLSLR